MNLRGFNFSFGRALRPGARRLLRPLQCAHNLSPSAARTRGHERQPAALRRIHTRPALFANTDRHISRNDHLFFTHTSPPDSIASPSRRVGFNSARHLFKCGMYGVFPVPDLFEEAARHSFRFSLTLELILDVSALSPVARLMPNRPGDSIFSRHAAAGTAPESRRAGGPYSACRSPARARVCRRGYGSVQISFLAANILILPKQVRCLFVVGQSN